MRDTDRLLLFGAVSRNADRLLLFGAVSRNADRLLLFGAVSRKQHAMNIILMQELPALFLVKAVMNSVMNFKERSTISLLSFGHITNDGHKNVAMCTQKDSQRKR